MHSKRRTQEGFNFSSFYEYIAVNDFVTALEMAHRVMNYKQRQELIKIVFEAFELHYEREGRLLFCDLIIGGEEGVFFCVNYLRFLFCKNDDLSNELFPMLCKIDLLHSFLLAVAKIRDSEFTTQVVKSDIFAQEIIRSVAEQNLPQFIVGLIHSKHPHILVNILDEYDVFYSLKDIHKKGVFEHAICSNSGVLLSHLMHKKDHFTRLCEANSHAPVIFAARVTNLLALKMLLDHDPRRKESYDSGGNNFQQCLVYYFNIRVINSYFDDESQTKISPIALKVLEYVLVSEKITPSISSSLDGRNIYHHLFANCETDDDIILKSETLLPILFRRNDFELWTKKDVNNRSPILMLLDLTNQKNKIGIFSQIIAHFAPNILAWTTLVNHFKERDVFEKILSLYSSILLDPKAVEERKSLVLIEVFVFEISRNAVVSSDFITRRCVGWSTNKKLEDLLCNLYLSYSVDQILYRNCSMFYGLKPYFIPDFFISSAVIFKKLLTFKSSADSLGNYEYLENLFSNIKDQNVNVSVVLKELRDEHRKFKSKYYKFLSIVSQIISSEQFDEMKEFAEINKGRENEITETQFAMICVWLSSSDSIERLRNTPLSMKSRMTENIEDLQGFLISGETQSNLSEIDRALNFEPSKTHYTILGYQ